MISRRLWSVCLITIGAVSLVGADSGIPRLEKRGNVTQLIVDGAPWLILGGELHNSAGSSIEYMRPIFPQLAELNLNTVLAPVYWQLVEPNEGEFHWTELDGLVHLARQHHLRLVLLWFGSWKNGLSHYAPSWVKRDPTRFPRAKLATGTTEVLSMFSEATLNADGRAFMAMLTHLKNLDEKDHTVLMVQIENEVGLLGDARDRSPGAEAAFAQPVPEALLKHLQEHRADLVSGLRQLWEGVGAKTSGTWTEVFGVGPRTDEIFMGWHYAHFLGRIAEAGRSVYPLPMYVNAWIVQPQDTKPGDYPSGGPQAHMLDIWRAGAPAIDVFAPDIYLPEFEKICGEFAHAGNPLFVPETYSSGAGLGHAFVAFGQLGAMGFSPFGIETREADPATSPLRPAYHVLRELQPLITTHQVDGTIGAATVTRDGTPQTLTLGGYTVTIAPRRAGRRGGDLPEHGFAMVIATAPDEFVVAGSEAFVTFAPASPGPAIAGLDRVEEGEFLGGEWQRGRVLNGDEVMIDYDMAQLAGQKQTGTGLKFTAGVPTIQKVKLYRYE